MDRRRLLLTAAASLLAVPAAAQGRRGRSAEPTEDEQPSADSLIPPGAAEGTLILDVHAHLLGSTRGDYIGAAQAAVRFMDQLGIEKTIVMPVPQPQNFRHSYDVDTLASALSGYADRFAFLGGGGSLNPMIQRYGQGDAVTDRVRREFAGAAERILAAGAIGFGEITAHHLSYRSNHPYESTPPDGPLMLQLADMAAARGVPIDLHMDAVREDRPTPEALVNYANNNPRTLPANIPGFERLLAHNRGARIVWAHAGRDAIGEWTTALSRELLQRHPNLYMSISLTPRRLNAPLVHGMGLTADWRALLEEFSDRFMIGTDHFYVAAAAGNYLARGIRSDPTSRFLVNALPTHLAAKIARENARALYKIRG